MPSNNNIPNDLRNTAALKARADNTSLVNKLETTKFVWFMLTGIVGAIATIAIWVGNIQHDKIDVRKDLDYNRSAIGKLWKEVFHNELP